MRNHRTEETESSSDDNDAQRFDPSYTPPPPKRKKKKKRPNKKSDKLDIHTHTKKNVVETMVKGKLGKACTQIDCDSVDGGGPKLNEAPNKGSCATVHRGVDSPDNNEPVAGPSWRFQGPTQANIDQKFGAPENNRVNTDNEAELVNGLGPSSNDPGVKLCTQIWENSLNEIPDLQLSTVCYGKESPRVVVRRASSPEVLLFPDVPDLFPWLVMRIISGETVLRLGNQVISIFPSPVESTSSTNYNVQVPDAQTSARNKSKISLTNVEEVEQPYEGAPNQSEEDARFNMFLELTRGDECSDSLDELITAESSRENEDPQVEAILNKMLKGISIFEASVNVNRPVEYGLKTRQSMTNQSTSGLSGESTDNIEDSFDIDIVESEGNLDPQLLPVDTRIDVIVEEAARNVLLGQTNIIAQSVNQVPLDLAVGDITSPAVEASDIGSMESEMSPDVFVSNLFYRHFFNNQDIAGSAQAENNVEDEEIQDSNFVYDMVPLELDDEVQYLGFHRLVDTDEGPESVISEETDPVQPRDQSWFDLTLSQERSSNMEMQEIENTSESQSTETLESRTVNESPVVMEMEEEVDIEIGIPEQTEPVQIDGQASLDSSIRDVASIPMLDVSRVETRIVGIDIDNDENDHDDEERIILSDGDGTVSTHSLNDQEAAGPSEPWNNGGGVGVPRVVVAYQRIFVDLTLTNSSSESSDSDETDFVPSSSSESDDGIEFLGFTPSTKS